MLLYVPIFVFAIIEGEIYYISMCVAAGAGKLAWQGFERDGHPIEGASGRRDGVPRWDLPQALALADGSFRILY